MVQSKRVEGKPWQRAGRFGPGDDGKLDRPGVTIARERGGRTGGGVSSGRRFHFGTGIAPALSSR
jgi:hypothetical protein